MQQKRALGLVGGRVLIAVRADGTLRAGRSCVVDDALRIDREVDHAPSGLKYDLRLRPGNSLIGE